MTRVVTLSILDGQRRRAPSELSVQSLSGGELFLLVEVSAPTATWDAACRKIIARAVAAFGGAERASEAVALQGAADAVSELLVASNRKLPAEEQVWASLNAAFIRKDHLYLAQAGPALSYVARGDSLTRFPKQASDLQVDPLGVGRGVRARMAHFQLQEGDRIALVSSQLPTFGPESELNELLKGEEIEETAKAFERRARQSDFSGLFIHVESLGDEPAPAPEPEPEPVAAPEPTVVAPAARGHRLPDHALPAALAKPRAATPPPAPPEPPPPPPEVEERTASRARAVVSRVQEGTSGLRERFTTGQTPAPAASGATGGAIVTTPRPAAPRSTSPSGAPRATAEPAPRQTTASAAAAKPRSKPLPAAPAPPRAERATTAVLTATVVEEEPAPAPPASTLKRRFLLLCYDLLYRLLAVVDGALAFGSERAAPTLSKGAPLLERLGNALWRLFALLGRGLRRVLRQMLPGMQEGEDAPATSLPPEKRSSVASALLLLLPIVLLLVVAGVAMVRDEGASTPGSGAVVLTPGTESAASLLSDAASLLEQAATVDAATGQRLAGEAVALVDRAVALEPPLEGSAAVSDLRARAQGLLAASGAVTYPPITQLATLPDGSQPAEVAIGGGSPFVLDRGAGAAFRVLLGRAEAVPLDPMATQPLLMAQQNLGNGVIVEPLAHLLWVPGGGTRPADALVILSQSGQLFEFEPESGILRNLPFAALTGESDIRAAEGFGGNLYLLDGAARQVWRYVPDASGGYSQPPQPWLSAAAQGQLGDPVDIAVDGFIYLLDASGAVARFQGGEAQPFALAPPPAPLTSASAIAKPAPESSDLFVAEGARVLRFAQDGSFLKEYRAPAGQEWGTIQDLAFDGGGALYLLTDRGLYSLDVR